MKKFFALVLAIFMVSVVTFVGCSSASNGGDSGDSAKKTPLSNITTKNITVKVNEVTSKDPVEEESMDLKSVLSRIEKSIVKVSYETKKNVSVSASGIVIGEGETVLTEDEIAAGKTSEKTSYILTSLNFIEEAIVEDNLDSSAKTEEETSISPVSITTYNGETYSASFVGADPDSDVCILYATAELSACDIYTGKVETGESIVAAGNSLSAVFKATFTSGIVSTVCESFQTEQGNISFICSDAFTNNGSAGGGLFTRAGYFIGLITEKYNTILNNEVGELCVAVPSNAVIDVSKKLMETFTEDGTSGYIPGKYLLGFSVKDYSINVFGTQGYVYFDSLDETGSFYKCGLRVEDKIISVRKGKTGEEYKVARASGFKNYIESLNLQIGDELVINIERSQTKLAVTVIVLQYIYGSL